MRTRLPLRRNAIWLTAFLILSCAWRAPAADEPSALDAPEIRRQANEAYTADRLEDAVVLGAKYLKLNPADGRAWFTFAYAHHRLKRYEPAIAAFRKAYELGAEPRNALYNIACGLALAGQTDAALDALQRAFDEGFVTTAEHLRTDADLASIRSHPRFNEITRLDVPADLGRDAKWGRDIDYFKQRLEQVHFHPFQVMKRDWFERAVADLKRDLPSLSDVDVLIRLQIILAAVGDGHTHMEPPWNRLQMLPVRFYEYADGLFVQATAPEQRELGGCRVLRIGKAAAEEALRAVRPMISHDNEQGIRAQAPRLLSIYEVLRFFSLTDDAKTVSIHLQAPSGEERKVELPLTPAGQESNRVFVREVSGGPPPLWLRNREKRLWFEFLSEDKLAYIRIWGIGDGPDEKMEQFAERVFSYVEQNDVAATVIDLRMNSGGNNYRNKPFMQRLLRCRKALEPGRLFVVADRVTFSAAMNLLADIEFWTDAIVVGEPAGSRPNFVGESTMITLPYSQATFSCSNMYHQHSYCNDFRTMIAPDLPVAVSSEDYRHNRDPALDTVRAYLARTAQPAPATAAGNTEP